MWLQGCPWLQASAGQGVLITNAVREDFGLRIFDPKLSSSLFFTQSAS